MGIFDWLFGKRSKESEVNDVSIENREVKPKRTQATKREVTVEESTVKQNIKESEEKKDVEGLIKALEDEQRGDYDSYIQEREKIIEELGMIGEPAVQSLIRALEDKNKQVRSGAAWALGEIKDKRAVGPLIRALEDDNNIVRVESAHALGEIGDKIAIEPLKSILLLWDSMPPGLINEARTALEKIK